MKENIKVLLDPKQRKEYIQSLLLLDNMSHIQEDPFSAYCPISLTSTPEELKSIISSRQNILKDILGRVGITAYDPNTAPYSPDTNLKAQPNEVYVVDSGKILGARFFVGHNILPSTGQGIEVEKAKFYNRIAVILIDKNIRVSRMQPHRAIYLQYSNFEKDVEKLIPVFELLKQYEPGFGLNGGMPVLLGFHKKTGDIVDLEKEVYSQFPELKYMYKGTVDIVHFKSINPKIFYENK